MNNPVKIKFCGITQPDDAELAASLGAWAVGVILWPGSKRACDPAMAAAVAATVRRQTELVGVFVDQTLPEVVALAEQIGLTMLQFHGSEGPSYCGEAARRTGAKIIKATRVHSRAEIQALAPFHTDFHLLDSYVPGVPGGTGETFEWELARTHRGKLPVILSGGLNPENVGQAITTVLPFAVDVASGIERSPGVKDASLMRDFVASVTRANLELAAVPEAV